MMPTVIHTIKSMILTLCENKEWDWKSHVESVVQYSKQLAIELHADEEICEISAWLHDIKKIAGQSEKHHIHGAEEAAKILRNLDYPEQKISQVMHCILTHSSDKNYQPESIEAKIVACADSLAHFDNFLALAYGMYNLKKYSLEEGRNKLIKKYQTCWEKLQLIPEAQRIAQSKYDVIKQILSTEN